MKNFFYLLVVIVSLSSCSSNDDDLDKDPIIGKWKLTSQKENNVENSDDCSLKSTITFSENNTVSVTSYFDFGNGCDNQQLSFGWKNLGNSNYEMIYDPTDKETITLVFSQNNSIFTFTETEIFNNVTYTSSSTYEKI